MRYASSHSPEVLEAAYSNILLSCDKLQGSLDHTQLLKLLSSETEWPPTLLDMIYFITNSANTA
jgi:hypothetical protein